MQNVYNVHKNGNSFRNSQAVCITDKPGLRSRALEIFSLYPEKLLDYLKKKKISAVEDPKVK